MVSTAYDRAPSTQNREQRDKDPMLGLRFWVEIDGLLVAGFSECSAPTMETEIYEYSEGGENRHTHKLPVRHKYGNITLKRGITEGVDLWEWYRESVDAGVRRKQVTIYIYGPTPNQPPLKTYTLRRAFPVKWTGPDMKSDAGSVAVETLELAHDGMDIA
jgi:phage tail-like protein